MALEAKVTPGNTMYITSGAQQHTIWLAPDFVNFEERLEIRARGKRRYYDFPTPAIGDILEDLRQRGDRQNTYLAKVVID